MASACIVSCALLRCTLASSTTKTATLVASVTCTIPGTSRTVRWFLVCGFSRNRYHSGMAKCWQRNTRALHAHIHTHTYDSRPIVVSLSNHTLTTALCTFVTTAGTVHHDDLLYLFAVPVLAPQFKDTDPENLQVERMTRMWTNFAHSG